MTNKYSEEDKEWQKWLDEQERQSEKDEQRKQDIKYCHECGGTTCGKCV